MDEIDVTDARMQKEMDEFLRKRPHTQYLIEGSGLCIQCNKVVKPVIVGNKSIIGRWCSLSCRDAWSEENT